MVATIGVHGKPYFIDVSSDGKRGYVANSGSANVSVIDLEQREVIAHRIGVGNSPGLARVSPDGNTVVVSNRGSDSVSLIDTHIFAVRSTIPICHQPEDIAILPDSSKAFVACSGSAQVASIDLKNDKLLASLDVGKDSGELGAQARRRRADRLQLRFGQHFHHRDWHRRSQRQLLDRHAPGARRLFPTTIRGSTLATLVRTR